MQNSSYPFSQKEHVFDFKVKVNFQNGNVSLTAPQIVTPPGLFAPQIPPQHSNNKMYAYQQRNHQPSMGPNLNTLPNHSAFTPFQQNQPHAVYNQRQNSYNQRPVFYNQPNLFYNHPEQQSYSKVQNVEMVNSSYTSFKDNQFQINNSLELIECVLCQKSFSSSEFENHLEVHKNRGTKNLSNRKDQQNLSHQKNGMPNNMLTQNSFNSSNQSSISGNGQNNYSFLSNQSRQGNFVQNKSLQRETNTYGIQPVTNVSNRNENSRQVLQALSNSFQQNKPKQGNPTFNQSFHLLGRIDNPILAINSAQQTSMTQSYSSHHPHGSLNYSNSSGPQMTNQLNDPNNINSGVMHNQNSPQFNTGHHSNNSSFGYQGGNYFISPSFFQNNSQESANRNDQFVKGLNIPPYNELNNSLGMQNLSMGSHNSNKINQKNPVLQSFSSHSSRNSHQNICPNNSGNMNFELYHLNDQNGQNTNMMLQNFQTVESRYLNQPATRSIQANSQMLHHSQQNVNQPLKLKNSQSEEMAFEDNDISSISRTSKVDSSQFSDWSDLNDRNSDPKLQGYNSADNSLMKNMQQKKKQTKPSVYMDRADNRQKSQEEFFKKKKDQMINSATSYYDRKFKDQQFSSSEEQGQNLQTVRLSYAQRLRQKKMTDSRPVEQIECKSGKRSRNLKESNQMSASKNSDSSNLSKTKIPVNYLAREQFIQTSTTSKSTHRSTNAN